MHPVYSIPMFVTSGLSLAFGLFVFLQAPAKQLNRIFCLLSISIAIWSFGFGASYCTTNSQVALGWARFAFLGVCFIPTFFFHFMQVFLKAKARKGLVVVYGLSILFLGITRLDVFMSGTREFFWGLYPVSGPAYWTFMIFFYGSFLYCVQTLLRARRQIPKDEANRLYRSQMTSMLWGYAVATLNVSDFLPNYGIPVYPFAYCAALGWLALMCYAVFRQGFMDPKIVIQKTIVYSTITALLTVIYVYFVSLFSGVSKTYFGQTTLLPSATVALVVAIAFHPLFRMVQSLVDRYFMRGKIDRDRRLLELSERLAAEESEEKVGTLLKDFVQEGFGATSVQVEREAPEALPSEVIFSLGQPPNPVGWLRVGAKKSGERYDAEEMNILRMAANQASWALGKKRLLHEFSEAFMHELKTPLSSITLPAELTLLDMKEVLEGQRPLREVGRKILSRMQYIMDQALLVGYRLEAVRLLLSAEQRAHEDTPVADVIAKAVNALQALIAEEQVHVSFANVSSGAKVRCDPRQLEIVFVNLLKNAIEEVSRNGSTRQVRVTVSETPESVQVYVEDSGHGLADGIAAKIFQPAFSTKKEQGRGMGLFLSQQIIAAHAGIIHVGKGSLGGACFKIHFPKTAKKEELHDGETALPPRPSSAT